MLSEDIDQPSGKMKRERLVEEKIAMPEKSHILSLTCEATLPEFKQKIEMKKTFSYVQFKIPRKQERRIV